MKKSVWISLGLCLALFFGSFFLSHLSEHSHAVAYQKAQAEHEQLINRQNVLKAARTKHHQHAVASSTGLSEQRKLDDDEVFTQFAQTATTWSNSKEYNAARNKLKAQYHLDEHDPLLTAFMPAVTDVHVGNKATNTIIALTCTIRP